jgi:penicillin-binding protein 1A
LVKLFRIINRLWSDFREWNRKPLPWYKRVFKYISYILAFAILFLFIVDVNFLWLSGRSPRIGQLYNPEVYVASELYSSDGKLIGKYFIENRTPVGFEEISPLLISTLVTTEDVRFYKHHGIDIKATLGIIWSFLHGERRGGSTITQQLVKNLFKTRTNYSKGLFGLIPGIRSVNIKIKEWITAFKIELFYSKTEILTMYLNTVDFGSNSYGIKSAARTYFNTDPSCLKIEESALLVGMLKAPTFYSPVIHPENALFRRNIVLGQLEKYNIITAEEYDSLCGIPVTLDYRIEGNYDGKASYFREAVASALKDWCAKNDYNLFTDGLKIFSTIDFRMQEFAEESMKKQMIRLQHRFDQHWEGKNPWVDSRGVEISGYIENIARKTPFYINLCRKYGNSTDSINFYLKLPRRMTVFTWKGDKDTSFNTFDSIRYYARFLNAGFITMDPFSGYVKTWVGGIDFDDFKYDHVRQSKRQPGSLFKAFVYTAAMEESGIGPCDSMVDRPVTVNYRENGIEKSWSPHNADWIFTGRSMTLKHAFARSVNSIAVQITMKTGWQKVIEYARKLGIRSELNDVPSVCLGSSDVSLFEMVNSFCTFVNGGYLVNPVLVTNIVDREGKIVYENKESMQRVISEETAFLMREMLRAGLTEPGGTTQALFEHDLFRFGTEFGGKTGTSSNHSDGWFIGITPSLVSGAWVGSDHRSIHFRTSEMGEGCKTALPLYGYFMEKLLADDSFQMYRKHFQKPEIKITRSYNCQTSYYYHDTTAADTNEVIIDTVR